MKTTWMISRKYKDTIYYLKNYKKSINAAYWTTDYESAKHFSLETTAKQFARDEIVGRDLCILKKEIPPDIVMRQY